MADYSTLKAAIRTVIKENGNEEITGTVLQGALISMINALGAGYTFMGVATPSTNPGNPDYNVAYLAGPGVYPNFDGITVLPETIAVLKLNGDEGWAVELIPLPGYVMGIVSHDITYHASTVIYEHVVTNEVMGLIPRYFIDQWILQGGTFTEGGYFAMNGINDLSYEDALAVASVSPIITYPNNSFSYFLMMDSSITLRANTIYNKRLPRTAFPLIFYGTPANTSAVYFFMRFCTFEVLKTRAKIEIVCGTSNNYFVSNSYRLRRIENITFDISAWTSRPTGLLNLVNIEYIEFKGLKFSLSLSAIPAFSENAVAYMITNAGTATITITLHADAYARAIINADVQAALAIKTNVTLASA